MKERWGFQRPVHWTAVILLLSLLHLDFSSCWSLNDQGLALSKFRDRLVRDGFGVLKDWNKDGGETHACSWLGFGCSDDKYESLHAGESGDFGYRRMLRKLVEPGFGVRRNGTQEATKNRSSPKPTQSSKEHSASQLNRNSLPPQSNSPSRSPSGVLPLAPSALPQSKPIPAIKPVVAPAAPQESHSRAGVRRSQHLPQILSGVLGGSFLLLVLAVGFVLFRSNKVVTVKPWATGLSGQLQKAFVTGVPKLNRSEIVVACEDFSNIIGSYSEGTVYKGTLSSGVEIAVTSTAVKSRQDWSKNSEDQFRNKVEKLSKLNHKNFVNLIGFCEEEEPFTRVMVFEYAPNGTLFEHLHIKEAEHLDWEMRLRIAMGMAYCLEYMHQLNPPIAHGDLHSSSVYLTEDYAAKISDFRFWNEVTAAKMQSASPQLLESHAADPESNVYRFGMILFEMITGKIPYVGDDSLLSDWASEYLKAEHSVKEMVDPTLKSFDEEVLEKLFQVIKDCINPAPKERPTMVMITARLKEITALGPDGATPKLSPLWWAELEIVSSEGS